jgi:glycerol-3-phosphate dehydrogenase
MAVITRNPGSAVEDSYDLIVVGGGIHGTMVALEAARRGLRPLVLEREDFGGATSYNNFRIIHGGLRYLQDFDLPRFRASVRDRRWFLRNFPDLIKPLPCIMPLYNKGIRRRSVFRLALAVNDLLSRRRNKSVPPENWLPRAHLVGSEETRQIFPLVDRFGLKGGAVWYDAWMPDSQRVLIETLRWACELGATALNYVEALRACHANGRIATVEAIDHIAGKELEFRTRTVVNASGPWCTELARLFNWNDDFTRHHSLAWNVLFDRPSFSPYAIAVAARKPGAQTYFLLPWKGKLLAGTGHAPWANRSEKPPLPSESQVTGFIRELNEAIPAIDLRPRDILRISAGLLPAVAANSSALSAREVIFAHGAPDSRDSFLSVSGVKFTTSRSVARKVVDRLFPQTRYREAMVVGDVRTPGAGSGVFDPGWLPDNNDMRWNTELPSLITDEAVCHLDDLVLRRTSLGDIPQRALELGPRLCQLFPWDSTRRALELQRLKNACDIDYDAEDQR